MSSALAALGGCARQAPPPDERPVGVVTVPQASAGAGELAPDAAATRAERDGGRAQPTPPLDVPAGVSAVGKEKYEKLASTMKRVYTRLDRLESALEKPCDILDTNCDRHWRAIADDIQAIHRDLARSFVCEGSSEEAKTFAQRETEHRLFYEARMRQVLQTIRSRTAASDKRAEERWKQHERGSEQANPQPCLKFACPDW